MEREIVQAYKAHGWDAMRTAGSHGPWDVVAVGDGAPLAPLDDWVKSRSMLCIRGALGSREQWASVWERRTPRSVRRLYVTVVADSRNTVVLIQCKRRKR